MSFLASLIGVWLTLPMTEGLVAILGIVLYCRVKKDYYRVTDIKEKKYV